MFDVPRSINLARSLLLKITSRYIANICVECNYFDFLSVARDLSIN